MVFEATLFSEINYFFSFFSPTQTVWFLAAIDYSPTKESKQEREESLLLLLSTCPLDSLFSPSLLEAIERVPFLRVTRELYLYQKRFKSAITAHLRVTGGNSSIFPFLETLLRKYSTEPVELSKVRREFLQKKREKEKRKREENKSTVIFYLLMIFLTSHSTQQNTFSHSLHQITPFFSFRFYHPHNTPPIIPQQYHQIRSDILSFVDTLLDINTTAFSQLLLNFFLDDHKEVMSHLDKHPDQQLKYLRVLADNEATSTRLTEIEHDLLVRLMCQFEPQSVYHHLLRHDSYRPIKCLPIVKQYGLVESHALLLEKIGDFAGALGVLMSSFKSHLESLYQSCLSLLKEKRETEEEEKGEKKKMGTMKEESQRKREESREGEQKEEEFSDEFEEKLKSCEELLQNGAKLCGRVGKRTIVEERDVQEVWFVLLDTIVRSVTLCRKTWFDGVVANRFFFILLYYFF